MPYSLLLVNTFLIIKLIQTLMEYLSTRRHFYCVITYIYVNHRKRFNEASMYAFDLETSSLFLIAVSSEFHIC